MRTSENNWEHQKTTENTQTPLKPSRNNLKLLRTLKTPNKTQSHNLVRPTSLKNLRTLSICHKCWEDFKNIYHLGFSDRDIRLKLISRLEIVNLLKVLGNLLTESQLLKWFQKYKTLTVFREIRFKLLSRLGKVNLLKVLGSLLTESHLLRGFQQVRVCTGVAQLLKLQSGHIWFGLVSLASFGQAWFAFGELIWV